MNCEDACCTCRGQFEKSQNRKIRTSPILSYIHPLSTTYTITTCHTLKVMTLIVIAKVSRLAMTKRLTRKAVTAARTETPSRMEMGALRELLCRTAHGVVFKAIGDQKYVLSRFCFSTASYDADDVCTDRIEAESRKKQLLRKLAIRIAPLGTKRKLELAAGKLGHHARLPPALCMRARTCRFICKAVVKIGWSCC